VSAELVPHLPAAAHRPGFCNQTDDDSNFPFPQGQLSGNDEEFVGFDIGDATLGLPMAALPGVDWST